MGAVAEEAVLGDAGRPSCVERRNVERRVPIGDEIVAALQNGRELSDLGGAFPFIGKSLRDDVPRVLSAE